MQGLMYQPKLLDHRWSRISQKNDVIQFQLIQYQSGFAKGCFRCSFSNSVVLPFCLHCFGFIFLPFFLKDIFKCSWINSEHLISKYDLLV